MARIAQGTMFDWKDGDTVTAAKYKQEREILMTAINDNYEKLIERYTKAEVDALLTAIKGKDYSGQTLKGLHDLILDRYTKAESNTTRDNLQKQIWENDSDILNHEINKLNISGDFKGTWNGKTLSQAASSLNGGRLDALEPDVKRLQEQVYAGDNTEITIAHNLNEFPMVQVYGDIGFGISGFGQFGFGGSVGSYECSVDYESNNQCTVLLSEELGVPQVTKITSRMFQAYFAGIDSTLNIRLI